jgi:hypothetical protein
VLIGYALHAANRRQDEIKRRLVRYLATAHIKERKVLWIADQMMSLDLESCRLLSFSLSKRKCKEESMNRFSISINNPVSPAFFFF